MVRSFILLMASSLPATLLFYFIGWLFLKKFKLTGVTIAVGFFAAWFITAVVSIFIADQPTPGSAMQSVVPAALIGSIIALACLAAVGKRKPSSQSKIDE